MKDEVNQINEPQHFIRGAFVLCRRVKHNKLTETFQIKLSSINTIVPINDDHDCEECLFYTYKDCCYYVQMNCFDLQKAVDSFIFQPETHWESYGM